MFSNAFIYIFHHINNSYWINYTQQHCLVIPKKHAPWRDSNPGLLSKCRGFEPSSIRKIVFQWIFCQAFKARPSTCVVGWFYSEMVFSASPTTWIWFDFSVVLKMWSKKLSLPNFQIWVPKLTKKINYSNLFELCRGKFFINQKRIRLWQNFF
jgi:hypothetical protein